MPDTINALVRNDVNEISLVPRGANKKQKILFFKSDNKGDDSMSEQKTFEDVLKELSDHPDGPALYDDPEKVEDFLKQAKLSDEAATAVKSALRIINSVKADMPGGTLASFAKFLGGESTAPKEEKPKEKEEEPIVTKKEEKPELDGIPAPIAKALKDQGDQITLLKEGNDKLATELNKAKETIVRKEFEEKVKTDFSNIPIEASELVEKLMTVAKSGDEELSKTIDTILGAADRVAAESKVFDEFGSGTSGGGTAYAKIEKIAEEHRKADPKLTIQQAIAKATVENPELYADYEKEKN